MYINLKLNLLIKPKLEPHTGGSEWKFKEPKLKSKKMSDSEDILTLKSEDDTPEVIYFTKMPPYWWQLMEI